jgi:hypothetical protein
MKKKMTLALASSMLLLTLAATPHRALAASNAYLYIDGIPGESESHSAPPPAATIVRTVLSIVFGI